MDSETEKNAVDQRDGHHTAPEVTAPIIVSLGIGIVAGLTVLNRQPVVLESALLQVINSAPYLAVVALIAVLHFRLILFRLGDKTRVE